METLFKKVSEKSNIIEGFENMSLLVFIMIAGYILYVMNRFVNAISQHRNEINSQIENIDNLSVNNHLGEDCPICHENIKNAVELDCYHKFCAKCIMDYYCTIQPRLSCPLCRKEIRLINILNYNRSQDMRQYIEMIVIFNQDHLNGIHHVKNLVYENLLFSFYFLLFNHLSFM